MKIVATFIGILMMSSTAMAAPIWHCPMEKQNLVVSDGYARFVFSNIGPDFYSEDKSNL